MLRPSLLQALEIWDAIFDTIMLAAYEIIPFNAQPQSLRIKYLTDVSNRTAVASIVNTGAQWRRRRRRHANDGLRGASAGQVIPVEYQPSRPSPIICKRQRP